MGSGRLPSPGYDLGLAEHGAKLVDYGGLDLTCGDASDRTSSRPVLQHRLADIIPVEPFALARMRR